MQASLSPGTYIKLLHLAAITGQIPILNEDGSPTGNFDVLDSQQRIDTAKYLLNKIVPDAPRIERHEIVNDAELTEDTIQGLPTTELMRLVNAGEIIDAPT